MSSSTPIDRTARVQATEENEATLIETAHRYREGEAARNAERLAAQREGMPSLRKGMSSVAGQPAQPLFSGKAQLATSPEQRAAGASIDGRVTAADFVTLPNGMTTSKVAARAAGLLDASDNFTSKADALRPQAPADAGRSVERAEPRHPSQFQHVQFAQGQSLKTASDESLAATARSLRLSASMYVGEVRAQIEAERRALLGEIDRRAKAAPQQPQQVVEAQAAQQQPQVDLESALSSDDHTAIDQVVDRAASAMEQLRSSPVFTEAALKVTSLDSLDDAISAVTQSLGLDKEEGSRLAHEATAGFIAEARAAVRAVGLHDVDAHKVRELAELRPDLAKAAITAHLGGSARGWQGLANQLKDTVNSGHHHIDSYLDGGRPTQQPDGTLLWRDASGEGWAKLANGRVVSWHALAASGLIRDVE